MRVSIVVPVFNAEKYLSKCIDSILVQSFTDFELLLIDDGSTDNSFDICRNYEVKDTRIHLFSQSNSGPSKARNLGISKAKGDFVTFIDSDDYVDPDYLLNLTKYDSDLVSSGFKLWYAEDNRLIYKSYNHYFKATNENNNMGIAIAEGEFLYLLAGPCCKLYRRNLLLKNKITFDETLTYGEDHLFNLKYLKYIDSIVLLPYSGYTYTHYGKPSLTNRIIPYGEMYRYNELSYNERKSLMQLYSFSKKYIEFIDYKYYFYFWQIVASIYLGKYEVIVRHSFLRQRLRDNKNKINKYFFKMPFTFKVMILLFNILPFYVADFVISIIFYLCKY